MSNFDGNIVVTISLDAPTVEEQNFGTPLIAGTSMLAGFTERIRFYANALEASADDDLSTLLQNAVEAAFSQRLKPQQVAVGRVDGAVAAGWNLAITTVGGVGDTHTVTILGQPFVKTIAGGETQADVVDDLIVLINAGSLPVTLTDNGNDFDIDADNAGQPLGVTYAVTGTAAGTLTNPTPVVTIGDELENVLVADSDWYGIALESRDAWDIEEAAKFAEANFRLLVGQTSDSDVLDGGVSTDIASVLQAGSYAKTAVLYHSDDSEFADVAWLANRLAVNPDENSTTWAYVTLVGVTPQDDDVTTTQKNAVLSKNANLYLTAKNVGATGNGTVAVGEWIDIVTTADWIRARILEDVTQTLLNYSNRGEKVPYTNSGFNVLGDLVDRRLDQGEKIGHFVPDSGAVQLPTLSEVSSSDRNARRYAFTFSTEPSGAIHFPTINGYVSVSA